MLARPPFPALCLLASVALLTSCSGVADLGETSPALAASEQATVREQAGKALAEGRYNAAWNQEVAAGADRERLEAIAVSALDARSRHADAMFEALRKRFGGLGSAARARVDALVLQARHADRWSRALALELQAADDPPAYTAAWAVYRSAPPDVAPSLLESIQAAREDREESTD